MSEALTTWRPLPLPPRAAADLARHYASLTTSEAAARAWLDVAAKYEAAADPPPGPPPGPPGQAARMTE